MRNIKIIFVLLTLISVFYSCRKEEDPGGVAIGDMCGEWYYTVDGDAMGKLYTSNNDTNDPNVIVISDQLGWYWFNIEAKANIADRTFTAVDTAINREYYNSAWSTTAARTLPYNIKIVLTDGKITKAAVTLPSGVKADMIEFKISFEDSTVPFQVRNVVGYRRSGFLEDENFVYIPDGE